jgi:hypothetical protein
LQPEISAIHQDTWRCGCRVADRMRAQQHLGLRDLPQLAEAFVGPRKEQNG